jgi:ParB/RepB/Spo0J family partition protein
MIAESKEDTIVDVDPRTLLPNPFQVRASASDVNFDELVESIGKSGLIEVPVIRETGSGYQIVIGHRRVAACIKLCLKSIRCILRQLSDEQMAEVVLEENLKRNSLNPIEEARGYANLRDRFHWSEEGIAVRFQKTRDVVAQRLRLLTFQEAIRELVANGQLTPSHAEAIATAPPHRQLQLAEIVKEGKVSVKRTAQMAKEYANIESSNQETLANIGPRIIEINCRLALLAQEVTKHSFLLEWFEFHSHPWKAQNCKSNISGLCCRFWWDHDPSSWNKRLNGAAKFTKAQDSLWHVQACEAVCAHCPLYEPRAATTSQT